MIKHLIIITLIFTSLQSIGQTETISPKIQKMTWGNDLTIEIKLTNDSSKVYNVKELYHTSKFSKNNNNKLVYYPVGLDKTFIDQLKKQEITQEKTTTKETKHSNKTLWSAIHYAIGGEYVHFVNCLMYSLETKQLQLNAAMLKRQKTDWKPSPMTQSYKRTRKWNYYIPIRQKYAIREYRKKLKHNQLHDLQNVPQEFITLFLETNDKEYKAIKDRNTKAKIDLIKILLSTNYLGEEQINYIKNRVLTAVTRYSKTQLPSVIILDDFNAAVAMSLNENGYKIKNIVFRDEAIINNSEKKQRTSTIYGLIAKINTVNKKVFENSLKKYYKK